MMLNWKFQGGGGSNEKTFHGGRGYGYWLNLSGRYISAQKGEVKVEWGRNEGRPFLAQKGWRRG